MMDTRDVKFTNNVTISEEEKATLKSKMPGLKIVKTKDEVMLEANERYRKQKNKEKASKPLTQRPFKDIEDFPCAA